jgi:hypothetical protein
MSNINRADITTWMDAAGLMAPLAGIGRQFSTPGAISPAPRRRLNARSRVPTPDPAFTPRTRRLHAVAELSKQSEAAAAQMHLTVDGRNSPIAARRENQLTMRWQQDQDGALVMSWTLGAC